MNDTALLDRPETLASTKPALDLPEHIVEVISDSGEGAQRCGQSLAAIAARSGNGIWTVEIIPAEIQPPARSVAGASGIRIRMGAGRITNGGDQTDLVMAFNEQVLLGRVQAGELKPGATIMLESIWREHKDPKIVASYLETVKSLLADGYRVVEMPLERECRALMSDPRRGKNMFVLGTLCSIYSFDLELARAQIAQIFGKKDAKVIASQRAPDGSRLRLGRAHAGLQVPHPGPGRCGAAGRGQRQHRHRPGRAGLGHGHLRHVPHHAGDLGLALPERVLRTRRRPRPPGRGRDRRLRLCHRRLLRRPLRGDHHLGPGLCAQAGRHRAGGDGRDPARRRQRAARRPQHRAADQGGTGRPAHRRSTAATATRPRW